MSGITENGVVERKHYPKIISLINSGLDAIYVRFPIKTDQVVIQQYDHIERYLLDYRFAQTNTLSAEPIKYIDDTQYEPFNDKVFLIEKVIDEDGQELYLNDEGHYWSVHTPAANIVQVPYPDNENSMVVVYRSGLKSIPADSFMGDTPEFTPASYYVDMPPVFLNALTLYIAAKEFGTLNSDQKNESNTYVQQYELACNEILKQGLFTKDTVINQKLEKFGWP